MVDQEIIESFFQWKRIELSPDLVANMEWQRALYKITISSETSKQFPVDRDYCLRFCKNIIGHCQKSGEEEVYEGFYDTIGELVSDVRSSDCYKTYFFRTAGTLPVSVRESKAIISDGTTGLTSWNAGLYLAGWLDREENEARRLLKGKKVIELGAGSGMTGIFALKRWKGISEYTFTDCHGKVLDNLAHNITRNCADWTVVREDPLRIVSEWGTIAGVLELNWEEISTCNSLEVDTILGADLVFDPCLVPSLVRTLKILIERKSGCEAVLVSCVRNQDTWHLFLQQLGQTGLSVNTELMEGDSTTPVYMVHVCRQ